MGRLGRGVPALVRSRPAAGLRETALYPPLKAFFEARGYAVKGEVRGCDLVARRGDEPFVIVELKLRFGLPLVLQGIDRLALTERVYLAVPRPKGRGVRADSRQARKLCRRLGLGLILVGATGAVAVLEEPVPYRPRPAKGRALRLRDEFDRRVGDPNPGGGRGALVTAYRQDALRLARVLAELGPLPLKALRAESAVPAAAAIMQRNVYGWFERLARGTYGLTGEGRRALIRFADALAVLPPARDAA
jgi:hypothetical protein